MELLCDLSFSRLGNAAPSLVSGWSGQEPEHRWTIGRVARMRLDLPVSLAGRCLLVEFQVTPFLVEGVLAHQRLVVRANGEKVGFVVLTREGRWAVRIPAELVAGRKQLRLAFVQPDAWEPSGEAASVQRRALAVCFRRLRVFAVAEGQAAVMRGTGGVAREAVESASLLAPEALAARFESLGDNCEFGLVQRHMGAEPLGLLRFSNLELFQLLRLLDAGFAGLGDAANLECWVGEGARPEYVMRDRAFMLAFHTFQHAETTDRNLLVEQQRTRLPFLARKLREDIVAGDKILVLRRNRGAALSEQEVLPLWIALRAMGPATLLWVVPASGDLPPGSVEQVLPGLLRGTVSRLAPDDDAHDIAYPDWLEICCHASALTAALAGRAIVPISA